jgi:hypothetical protein
MVCQRWFRLASATDWDIVVHAAALPPKPPAEFYFMRAMRHIAPALACGLTAFALPAQAAALLAPHRAVYDLSLGEASEESGIIGIAGRMVYEFGGSACRGYTTKFRMVTQIETEDATRLSDMQTTSFEGGDGRSFDFASKNFLDQKLDKEVKGVASLGPTGTAVRLEKPEAKTLELERTQFPTQHLLELIDKARAKETFYQTTLFDGSEDADEVTTTTAVIGHRTPVAANDPERKAIDGLANDSYWPVEIAYFDLSEGNGEETPSYRISFKLHENGVTRDLTMDYGDFSVTGKLVDLELFDTKADSCSH